MACKYVVYRSNFKGGLNGEYMGSFQSYIDALDCIDRNKWRLGGYWWIECEEV